MKFNDIIIGCKNNNNNAQSELYKLLYPNLISICKKYGKDYHESNDFLQIGFMAIISNLHKFKGDNLRTLKGFGCKIVRNKIIDNYRQNKSLINNTVVYDNVDYCYITDTIDEDNFELYFDSTLLAIDELTPTYKKAVNMFYLQNMKHHEIAKELGISVGT